MAKVLNEIRELLPHIEFMTVGGLDDAVIGYDGNSCRLIYSCPIVIEIIMSSHNIDKDEAVKYFKHQIEGMFVGERMPIWMYVPNT